MSPRFRRVESFDRNGKEVQTDHRAECASVGPARETFSPENCQKQWDENDAGAGDETGLRGRGVEETGSLEGVAAEHEEAKSGAGEKFFPFKIAQNLRTEHGHQDCGEREAEGEEDEDGGVGERVFYDDEGSTPEQGAEDEGEVGFRRWTRHGWEFEGEAS